MEESMTTWCTFYCHYHNGKSLLSLFLWQGRLAESNQRHVLAFLSFSTRVGVYNALQSATQKMSERWRTWPTIYQGRAVPSDLAALPKKEGNRSCCLALSPPRSSVSLASSPTCALPPSIQPARVGRRGRTVLVIMFHLFPTVSPVFSAELSK